MNESTEQTCDLAIIGAGAAGLAAAIFAAEAAAGDRHIVVVDRAPRVGAKILISGGGRCNVTHDRIALNDFFGEPRPVVRNILAAFDEQAASRWFESLGVPLKREETGKLFPVSDRAASVLDALLRRAAQLGVEIRTDSCVDKIRRDESGFLITLTSAGLRAQRLILATGGRSLPRTGSDGLGWNLAAELGHTVTATYPALVPLVLSQDFLHARLSGLSCDVELSTTVAGKRIDRRDGSLLFTHFGISGPVVLDASRHWVIANAEGRDPQLRCNFRPGRSPEDVDTDLAAAVRSHPRRSIRRQLAEWLPDRLASALAELSGDSETAMGQMPRQQRKLLLRSITALDLPVTSARGWDFAEVTAGGVPLGEIDYRSMESRRVPGLYLVGEMLDCDGRIGGFNFQWAWATGHLAGRAAARAILAEH